MSINIMSAIFRTDFRDLQDAEGNTTKASTAKFICIALADHANDEGEGAYPSISKIAYKTNLSRTAVINALDALKYNGILTANGTSKWDTVNYTVNLICFSKDSKPTLLVSPLDSISQPTLPVGVNPLDSRSQPTLPVGVNPLDPNHTLTIPESYIGDKSPLPIEWQIAAGKTEITIQDNRDAEMRDAANLIAMSMSASSKAAYNLAYAFMSARCIVIPESKIKGQRKAVKEMIQSGVTPENIADAVKELTAKGMTITDLFSVSKTAISLANPAPEFGYNPKGLEVGL